MYDPFGKAAGDRAATSASSIRREWSIARTARCGRGGEAISVENQSWFATHYNWEAIAATVRKTHRVIVAYEDHVELGVGSGARVGIADELFEEAGCSSPARCGHGYLRGTSLRGGVTFPRRAQRRVKAALEY